MVHKSGMEHIAYITEDVHLFFCSQSWFNPNFAYWDVDLGTDVIDNHFHF